MTPIYLDLTVMMIVAGYLVKLLVVDLGRETEQREIGQARYSSVLEFQRIAPRIDR